MLIRCAHIDRNTHPRKQTCSVRVSTCVFLFASSALSVACTIPQRDQSGTTGHDQDNATMTANDPENQSSLWRSNAQWLSELIDQSRNDLAKRLNLDTADITVTEARHVMWPDSSAGCPTPGYEYMQMRMAGVLIRLDAGGRTYQYHSAKRGSAFLCEKPVALNPPSRFEER